VPATGTVVNMPVPAEGLLVSRPAISVSEAVAFNCVALSAVPDAMLAGAGQVMVGVIGHPFGVHE
jgi:hypothetical protein